MRQVIIALILALVVVLAVADDRPTTYYVGSGSGRGVQKTANGFAMWNETANTWESVLPLTVSGTVNGMVLVGGGALAYGSFSTVNGNRAASLAYWDGNTWCVPESVGLYNFNPTVPPQTAYENPPTGIGSGETAVVNGNDVYLLGQFNQVGLTRDGVAGFVRLTWSQGGFTVNTVGNGYFQQIGGVPCAVCARSTQPSGLTVAASPVMYRYTVNNQVYYSVRRNGDIFQYPENGNMWTQITAGNAAVNLTGAITDYQVFENVIYVVGNFERFNAPAANQYFLIAKSMDAGASWERISATAQLPVANFGNLPAVFNNNGQQVLPALTGTGFTSIAVENANSIYVAGGYRIDERDENVNFLAGHMQSVIIHITPNASPLFTVASRRWSTGSNSGAPNYISSTNINYLQFLSGILYAIGDFDYYNQEVITTGARFSNRYTQVYRYAAKFENGVWSPAFGGYLTSGTSDGNVDVPTKNLVQGANNVVYFKWGFTHSWETLSGGVFGYDGERSNETNRWHPVLENQRFAAIGGGSTSTNNGVGRDGVLYSALVTNDKDALILGGNFDFIGNQRLAGIVAYTPDDLAVRSVGGGLYQYNNNLELHGDNQFNNRVSGSVYDIEERGKYLYAAGQFNRNNTNACLSNIARYEFRKTGQGWEPLDGGCDNIIRDILFDGSLLYITGSFDYCGTDPAAYKESGGLLRGRVPTKGIAVLDTSKDYEKQSWRPLGVGIDGQGLSLALFKGDVYVGGSFTSAGGKLQTANIARWNGKKWMDVVGRCRGACSRPVNVNPYIGTSVVPSPGNRRPSTCNALGVVKGKLFCFDGNSLAWWSGSSWRRAGVITVSTRSLAQNSLIARNDSESQFVLVGGNTAGDLPNDRNYQAWDSANNQWAPAHTGFSVRPNAIAGASSLTVSILLLAVSLCLYVFLL